MIIGRSMDVRIRLSEERDKQQILQLLNSGFSTIQRSSNIRGDEFWDWKYMNSPFGRAKLTIAELDKNIVAVDNMWPWEFHARGTVIKALQPCDSIVHPDFRGQGLFRKMRLHGLEVAKADGVRFLFNFPNESSLGGNVSLGWHFIGRINWWVKLLKPVDVLRDVFSKVSSEPLIPDKEYLIDFNVINHIAQDGVNFDGFIKINRVEGFHEWRYGQHPSRVYGSVVFEQGNKKTALIFTVQKKGTLREMVIVDIIGSQKGVLPAIGRAVDAGRKMNIALVAIIDNPKFGTDTLWKLGFVRKKMKNMVVLPLELGIDCILKNKKSWSLVAGMHDSI